MMAGTWSDSDFSSSDDEDEKSNDKEIEEKAKKALICLMATDSIKDDKESKEEFTKVVILDNS